MVGAIPIRSSITEPVSRNMIATKAIAQRIRVPEPICAFVAMGAPLAAGRAGPFAGCLAGALAILSSVRHDDDGNDAHRDQDRQDRRSLPAVVLHLIGN